MGNKPRRWIKLYCYETLHGSVSYQLSDPEQGVWHKLLCYAGLCGNEGVIADHDLRPFPENHIIRELNTTPELYKSTLEKCKAEGRIKQNGDGSLIITNWTKYQSEYDRQKPYRQQKDRHLYVGPGRAGELAESINNVNTEEHMKAWEDAHPGRVHPGRLATPEEAEE